MLFFLRHSARISHLLSSQSTVTSCLTLPCCSAANSSSFSARGHCSTWRFSLRVHPTSQHCLACPSLMATLSSPYLGKHTTFTPHKHLFSSPRTFLRAPVLCDGLYSKFLWANEFGQRYMYCIWSLLKAHNVHETHCRLWTSFDLRRWFNFNSKFSKLTWPFISSPWLQDLGTVLQPFWESTGMLYLASTALRRLGMGNLCCNSCFTHFGCYNNFFQV